MENSTKINTTKLKEKKLEGNAEVVLTDNIVDQIEFLHDKVGSVEWSGVLVYKILEGSIEDHKNLVVEVQEILPMDVGTSSYTEYTIDPKDSYTFDNLFDRVMVDPELKIGHIHTHHNMNCFFSATDMAELHDNAPAHNYYLSLIVNFKDFNNWCAKIAMVGEESHTGSIVRKFKGTDGSIVEAPVNIERTDKVLYTIDMDITYDVPEDVSAYNEFEQRVIDLQSENSNRNFVMDLPYLGNNSKIQNFQPTQTNLFSNFKTTPKEIKKGNLERQNIKNFTKEILCSEGSHFFKFNSNKNTLDDVLNVANIFINNDADKGDYLDEIENNFEELFVSHFKVDYNFELAETVAKKVIDILNEHKEQFSIVEDIVHELAMCFIFDGSLDEEVHEFKL
tara:strand:- start:1449 stop:2627 length:1179 start_codon:yes stop_codon:yes gene_type:complete